MAEKQPVFPFDQRDMFVYGTNVVSARKKTSACAVPALLRTRN